MCRDKLEESAERIQKSIVGSLKTILNEVQDALGNPSKSPLGACGGGGAHTPYGREVCAKLSVECGRVLPCYCPIYIQLTRIDMN